MTTHLNGTSRTRLLPGVFVLLFSFFYLSLFSGSLSAQKVAFTFDPAQTRVDFGLGDILHAVHGSFQLKSGLVSFDKVTGAAQGLIVVDATSGNSGSEGRDRRMHKEILESQRYPEIAFAPVHVQGQLVQGQLANLQGSSLEIDGVLTLHGTQHPMTVTARLNPAGDQLNASSQFEIPYVQWGLKNPSTFILRVSSKVNIEIRAAGRLTESSNIP